MYSTKKKVTLKDKEKQKDIYDSREDFQMKSGYGVNITAGYKTSSYQKSEYITSTPAIIAHFPEFNYAYDGYSLGNMKSYNRILEKYKDTKDLKLYSFKNNEYSVYSQEKKEHRPVHFTPVWYPDYEYRVSVLFSQIWTPVGELVVFKNDKVDIRGSYFDDWVNVPSVEHPFGEQEGQPVIS